MALGDPLPAMGVAVSRAAAARSSRSGVSSSRSRTPSSEVVRLVDGRAEVLEPGRARGQHRARRSPARSGRQKLATSGQLVVPEDQDVASRQPADARSPRPAGTPRSAGPAGRAASLPARRDVPAAGVAEQQQLGVRASREDVEQRAEAFVRAPGTRRRRSTRPRRCLRGGNQVGQPVRQVLDAFARPAAAQPLGRPPGQCDQRVGVALPGLGLAA